MKKIFFLLIIILVFFSFIINLSSTMRVYAEETSCLQYDLNSDGTVDAQDILMVDNAMASAEGEDRYDSRAD